MKDEGYNEIKKTLKLFQKWHIYVTYTFGAPECYTYMLLDNDLSVIFFKL